MRLRLLGGFEAVRERGRLRPTTRKAAALLALLGLRPGIPVPRARLAALLWPESGEAAARTSLRQALAMLRKDLGEGSPLPVAEGDDLLLPADQVESDVAAFERALADPSRLAEAAALHAGELLAGFDAGSDAFEDWRRDEAARLRDRLAAALGAALAQAGGASATTLATALLTVEPAAEDAHQALIRAHLAEGALGAAMRQYAKCRDALQREFGVPPSPATEELRARIRAPQAQEGEGDDRPALAVLPFTDLSDDPAHGWLAQAFAEDLTAALSRFRVLHVVAAASVAAAHEPGAPMTETATRLGARYLLTGSLRRAGTQVRLTADLTDVREGRHLWAQRLDLPADRLPAIEDEMVAAIAGTLAKRLEQNLVREARQRPAADLRAWECWLRGLFLLRTGDEARAREAEALFRRALDLDPGFARAEAGLSLVNFNDWSCMAWDRWTEREHGAFTHAQRAVALDESDPLAHMILGRVFLYRRDFDRADHHLARAEALNPHDADLQTQLALTHCMLGRPEQGRDAAALAARLNPFHDDWYFAYAAIPAFCLGDYRGALALADRAPEIATDMEAWRAAALAHLGRLDDAAAALERFQARFRERITFGRAPKPGEAARWLAHVNPFRRAEDLARLMDGARKAGLEDGGKRTSPRTPQPFLRPGD
nr:BTAD domain-containing putative transcriptional regulator [Neoroseomonas eburnea]